MRVLWSLPKAAPAILRHLMAYAELAGDDLKRTQRDILGQIVALAVVAVAGFFFLSCACLAVVAATWDTSYRVAAVLWMGGTFLVIGGVAAVYASKISTNQAPLLDTVRREWREDRIILDRILSSEPD